MLMKCSLFLFIGIVAISASSCRSRSDASISVPPAPAFDAPIRLADGFVPSGSCTPLGDYRPPVVGLRIIYYRPSKTRVSRTIEAASDNVLTISLREIADRGQDAVIRPPLMQRTVAGLLPASGVEATRQLTYDGDPIAAIEQLSLGQTVEIGMIEATAFGGLAMSLAIPAVVKYEACGAVSVGAEQFRVRVYRVSSGGRSYRQGRSDSVRRSEAILYLSASHGYPLIYQSGANSEATVAEMIQLPTSSISPS